MNRESRRKNWQLNVILTAGVMATVLAGLILAQLDALQSRMPEERDGLPIVNIQATAVAVGQVIPLLILPELDDPEPETLPVVAVPDDQNPRPDIITGVSQEGVIFTVCGEVPEGWLLYNIQPGDTLASLAAAVQSTEAELAEANCLTEPALTAGMQILVPREPAAAVCGPPQWWVRYQVQRGDTLGGLAQARRTTVDEILRANCRDSLDLLAGQFIFLPPGSGPGVAPSVLQPSLTPLSTVTSSESLPTGVATATATNVPAPTTQPIVQPTFVVPSPIRPSATPPFPATQVPPTNTPPPPPTQTPVPPPTNTPVPPPTSTPVPPPTNTPVPPPTNTPPPPPTNTPVPPPTDTPPTDTPVPSPTDTPPTEPAPTESAPEP
ncbi:MAG: LysM peptidoglycan-binding domain-containing protein [Chloroflexota bacterium]|jgi:LysM repeat protein